MKQRIMRALAIGVAGTMISGLAACGGVSAESKGSADTVDESDISVGIVLKTATNERFQDNAYGAMMAGYDLGIEVKVDNTATESDVEGQITKCEDLISAGVKGLILTPNDSEGVSAAVQAAHDAEIPFITVDTKITNHWGEQESEYLPTYIGVDYKQEAYELAIKVFEELGGEGNVVMLRGIDAASSSKDRVEGFEQAIDEYENIHLVASQSADYDQDTACSTMSDIIQQGNEIDAVLCCNDLMALGSITALEENDIEVGGTDGVLVVGFDSLNMIALEYISSGKMYASVYDWPLLQGYYAVEYAYSLMQGEDVPDTLNMPCVIITKENVADYIPHAEELAEWQMGSSIEPIPDNMRSFLDVGLEIIGE